MGRMLYGVQMSLDGYVADRRGRFDWAEPGEDVHTAVNESLRGVGTFLLGRRMYEVLHVWDDLDVEGQPAPVAEFAEIWRGADKVVYSRSLAAVDSPRTRVEQDFDIATVRESMASADRDFSIGGPELAARALAAGLVDEVTLWVYPVVVGGGTAAFTDVARLDLELVDTRSYAAGVVGMRYLPVR